jgi:uncharacterized membrane protein YoaK (UPF0700 family)
MQKIPRRKSMSDDMPATQVTAFSPKVIQSRSIILLSGTSGYFDAICFLGLKQIFPANMTGNTVLLGIALGQGKWVNALLTGSAIMSFCVGALLTSLLLTHRQPGVWTAQVTRMFGIEWALLLLFSLLWLITQAPRSFLLITILLIILASLAMGIQSATVKMLGIPGVVTTYITGTITSLMGGLGDWLRSGRYHLHAPHVAWPQVPETQKKHAMARQASTWFVYILGAICGGAATLHLPTLVSCLPLITIGLVITHALRRLRARP